MPQLLPNCHFKSIFSIILWKRFSILLHKNYEFLRIHVVDFVLSVGAIEHVKCSKCRYLNWSIVLRNSYSEPDFLNQLTSTTRNCTNLLWNFSTHHNVRVLWSMIWLRQPTGTLTGSDGLIPSKLHCSNLMGVDMVVVVAAPMGQPQSMSRSTQWNR